MKEVSTQPVIAFAFPKHKYAVARWSANDMFIPTFLVEAALRVAEEAARQGRTIMDDETDSGDWATAGEFDARVESSSQGRDTILTATGIGEPSTTSQLLYQSEDGVEGWDIS